MGTITNTSYKLYVDYKAGVAVDFYVDGVNEGSITTGLPTGATGADDLVVYTIESKAVETKAILFSYVDFWQGV